MINSYKVEGIIIKRSNFGEGDKIITLFSQNYGKIKTLAKGVRKIKSRRAPHIELFNYSRIFLHKGQNFDIITEAEGIDTFSLLKKDLKKVAAAYYIAELVDKLCPERQEHNDILYRLIGTLKELNSPNFSHLNSLIDDFSYMIVSTLGFLPAGQKPNRGNIQYFIESVIERKLKTSELLTKIVG